MESVLALNGPNINLLGVREPAAYGSPTIADGGNLCHIICEVHGLTLGFRQSSYEGVLNDCTRKAGAAQATSALAGAVFNAGAYAHTSIALHDAITGTGSTCD
jgi:3-dehydroquinate dehydratase-2